MPADTPRFTRTIRELPESMPFVGPEAIERRTGRRFELRLGANESAFGVSPRAAAAMREAVDRISWYGDSEAHELRHALAATHGVRPDELCFAGGIDELLGLTTRVMVEPGTPVVTSLGGYPTFNYHVAGYGGVLHTVPYRNDHEDLDGLLAAVRDTSAPLVYLANPDNPMGSWHGAAAVQAFIEALPMGTLCLLDEAYIEFAPAGTAPAIDPGNRSVVRMRTFSKAHGMAGARVGYAIAHRELVGAWQKVRNHFGMSRVSLAGALASHADRGFVAGVVREVAAGREHYQRIAAKLGLAALPSATNFVAMDTGSGARARALLAALQARGVFVRMPGVAPLDRCIRVTVGTAQQRERFAVQLEAALAG